MHRKRGGNAGVGEVGCGGCVVVGDRLGFVRLARWLD